jgi:hypothetical protein
MQECSFVPKINKNKYVHCESKYKCENLKDNLQEETEMKNKKIE